ncbi:MAG: hypothetical protein ACFCU4_09165 [Puniceicoccaceae bacterium]
MLPLAVISLATGGLDARSGLEVNETETRELDFHVSRIALAYEPETPEMMMRLFNELNKNLDKQNLPIFAFDRKEFVDESLFRIDNVRNAENEPIGRPLFADLTRLVSKQRELAADVSQIRQLRSRSKQIRETLGNEATKVDKTDDLPFTNLNLDQGMKEEDFLRLREELEEVEAKLALISGKSTSLRAILLPTGIHMDDEQAFRKVAALPIGEKLDQELFLATLRVGYSYTVEIVDRIPVEKVYGRPELGQNPDLKYFPERHPTGVRLQKTVYRIVW